MQNDIMKIFHKYTTALEQGNFEGAFEIMAENVIWHMGGQGALSGEIIGKKALEERLKEFAKRSNGTFKVITNWAANNHCFVAASVISLAEKENHNNLHMPGIDLFKIENGKIQEVWTFAKHQSIDNIILY